MSYNGLSGNAVMTLDASNTSGASRAYYYGTKFTVQNAGGVAAQSAAIVAIISRPSIIPFIATSLIG